MQTRLAMGTALSPVAPMSGLIFFLLNRLKIFTMAIPEAMDNAKARKTAHDDAYRLHVEERIHGHGTAYAEAQEDGSRVHDGVGSRIEQARGVGTDFFQ